MWFVILFFGMQMTGGLCKSCCLQGSYFEMLDTIWECQPELYSLVAILAVIIIIILIGLPCVWRWWKRRGCHKDNIIQKLKKYYSGASNHEISLTGASRCRVSNQRGTTCYEGLLTMNDDLHKRRVLFLGHSEVSQYILREWSNGNILGDQVLIYIKDGGESCILEFVKNILDTDNTDYLLEVLKQIPVIVLINLDLYSTKRDQVGEKIIDVDQLLKDNISQFPRIKVWATSGAESGDHGFVNRDFAVHYEIEEKK